jgi:hypothetical protein
MRMAFSWIGQDVEIEEGSGAHWATYQLGLPQIATSEEVRRVLHLARLSQPARCRLWRIYTDIFDRRPVVVSKGPVLGNGWLSFYSGVPVEGDIRNDTDGVLVSFGVRGAWLAEQFAPDNLIGSFGSTVNLGFLAPYLDRFLVGRSGLSQLYPRGHGFVMSSLFSILWADRATAGRGWRGFWDQRDWREYTGFDRKFSRWKIRQHGQSRSQLVPGWGEKLSDSNARLGATFAVVINNPGRLGDFVLSAHDPERRLLRLHEMFSEGQRVQANSVDPDIPASAGVARLTEFYEQTSPERGLSAFMLELGILAQECSSPQPFYAAHLTLPLISAALAPEAETPFGVRSYLAPTWAGAWTQSGRTWRTAAEINTQ